MRDDASAIVGALAVILIASSIASTAGAQRASAATGKKATTVLASLPISGEVTSGYARDLFKIWVDADGDGCDTREEVLIMERVSGSISGCSVQGGRWVSHYDGVATSNPSTFDIDRLRPRKWCTSWLVLSVAP